MSLITVLKVSLTFPQRPIFHEIGFQVQSGHRIGLVGPNGSGKTSLLKLINGEISPDKGEIRKAKGARIGYLPQDIQEGPSGPLFESVRASIPGRKRLERERIRVEQALGKASLRGEQDKLAQGLAEIHPEINSLDFEFPPHEAEKILSGLGFKTADFPNPVSSLSGGWKTRAALAGLLFQSPDLLLLDEPTNHLDIPSVRWLEQFLRDFKGAMILVSHDRDFLNRQVHRIISFEPEGMRSYSGNYDFYLKTREEEKKFLEAKARSRDQKIKEARKFIERFRAKASKARQAQSKIKLVKKMEVVEQRRKEKTIHFSFPEVARSGREVVSIKGLSKGFGENLLYQDVDLTVLRGERIAVIGPNGCGKTTLLKMVAGEMETDQGRINLGHGVNMAYFAQHHADTLSPEKSVVQEVYQVVPNEGLGYIRAVLGAFLFSGGDVDKNIGVLSGGEKARVSLAKLLVRPGNLMVMDEPTNHLDIASSETLIDALTQYNGTLLFVSHNQSFINRLATKIWDIKEAGIVVYPGNLNEYYDHVERSEIIRGPVEETSKGPSPGERIKPKGVGLGESHKNRHGRKAKKRERAEERRQIHETLKPIREELESLEGRIAELESRQKGLENVLADPEIFKDKKRSVPLLKEYSEGRSKLDELLMRWEWKQGELESTKKGLGLL
ncbi:MAG: ABC-F family ATP-binding cassette domain-containing protein [Deltaproteobacteria bacterium]|nr:ABC-F family ATP-binding cassette domain-containing protein [Deltaproteobacteria bacterium]